MLGYRGKSWDLIVLSYGLAIVTVWFGISEIIAPINWIGFEPAFIGTSSLAVPLVILHGVLLLAIGICFAINKYTKIAAWIFVLMLLEIIATFAFEGGAWDIVVRDIGLCGAALSVALRGRGSNAKLD